MLCKPHWPCPHATPTRPPYQYFKAGACCRMAGFFTSAVSNSTGASSDVQAMVKQSPAIQVRLRSPYSRAALPGAFSHESLSSLQNFGHDMGGLSSQQKLGQDANTMTATLPAAVDLHAADMLHSHDMVRMSRFSRKPPPYRGTAPRRSCQAPSIRPMPRPCRSSRCRRLPGPAQTAQRPSMPSCGPCTAQRAPLPAASPLSCTMTRGKFCLMPAGQADLSMCCSQRK